MNRRVIASFAFGSALVLAAYTFSDFGEPTAQGNVDASLGVVAARAPERQYIPTTDSNNDGVPDWQEVLQTTEPIVVPEEPIAYEAPESLTGSFALNFFESYIRNKSFGEFGNSPEQFINSARESLTEEVRDELYTINDISPTRDNSIEAWRRYANQMASIVINGPDEGTDRNELLIVEEAMSTGNMAVLQELEGIIRYYQVIREQFLRTTVPSDLAVEHLDLINATNAVLQNIRGFRQAESDPLYALMRLQRYQADVDTFYQAILNLQQKISARGVTFGPDEPAAQVMIVE
jgi:hypothetical protein